jgi:hypothetical protein
MRDSGKYFFASKNLGWREAGRKNAITSMTGIAYFPFINHILQP